MIGFRVPRLAKIGTVIAIAMVMAAVPLRRAEAATTVFSGKVTDAGSAVVVGATLTFTDITHPGVPVTASTDVSGNYSTSLTSLDYYTIQIDPPSGSGLVTTTYYQYQVAGASASLNITLRTSTNTVNGTVQDKNGVLLPNETVRIKDGKGILATTTTDANGAYSLTAPSYNDYLLETTGTKTASTAIVPNNFTWNLQLNLTSNTTATVAVQAVNVTVSVRDTNEAIPVGLIVINPGGTTNRTTSNFTFPAGSGFTTYSGTSSSGSTVSADVNGTATFTYLASSTYTVSAIGSSVEGYGTASSGLQTVGTSDATITVHVPVNRHTVSGTITSVQSTNGISYYGSGVEVSLSNLTNGWGKTVTTDSFGNYSITAGTTAMTGTSYRLSLHSTSTGAAEMVPVPGTFNGYTDIDLSSNRTGNIAIPFDTLFFTAADNLGQGIHMPLKIAITSSGTTTLPSPFTGAGSLMATGYTNVFADSGNGVNYFRPVLHGRTYTAVGGGMSGTVFGTNTVTGITTPNGGAAFVIPNNMGTPSNLNAVTPTSSYPALTWSYSASGPAAAASYEIYRDGTLVGTSTTASFSDNTVPGAGSYSYQVAAVNSQGTVGPKSTAFSVSYAP